MNTSAQERGPARSAAPAGDAELLRSAVVVPHTDVHTYTYIVDFRRVGIEENGQITKSERNRLRAPIAHRFIALHDKTSRVRIINTVSTP